MKSLNLQFFVIFSTASIYQMMTNVGEFFGGFMEFLTKQDIINLGVGTAIGLAVTSIVQSLSIDLIMPIITPLAGFDSLDNFKLKIGVFEFGVGNFINKFIFFLITAFVIYIIIQVVVPFFRGDDNSNDDTQ